MMMKKNFFVRVILTVLLTVFINLCVKAQVDPGDPGDDPDRVPLDPGTWVLVAAGTGYGIKKLRDAKRTKNDSDTTTFMGKKESGKNY